MTVQHHRCLLNKIISELPVTTDGEGAQSKSCTITGNELVKFRCCPLRNPHVVPPGVLCPPTWLKNLSFGCSRTSPLTPLCGDEPTRISIESPDRTGNPREGEAPNPKSRSTARILVGYGGKPFVLSVTHLCAPESSIRWSFLVKAAESCLPARADALSRITNLCRKLGADLGALSEQRDIGARPWDAEATR